MNLDFETLKRGIDRDRIVQALFLPCSLIFQELVFSVSTTGKDGLEALVTCLFSIAVGLICRLAVSFLPTKRANKIATAAVSALIGVVFSVEYFVYREFKHFYDLRTVTAGAGDVATSFSDEIFGLVFSPAGLLHIALFLLPAILFLVYGKGECKGNHEDVTRWRIHMLRDAFCFYIVSLLSVACVGPFLHTYTDRYNFQQATESFGLITGLRKEVLNLASPKQTVTFTYSEPEQDVEEATDKEAEETEEATEYGLNALDIDFNKLAETTEGTWAELDRYVAGLAPSSKNEMTGRFAGYNLVFISCEALSAEAIRPDTTPTLYRMATKGIVVPEYYQFDSAGTTGGECANLFGFMATEGGSSVKMCADHNNYMTIGNMLNRQGYTGWAFHNNTYTYYGRDATHNNLGYSEGYMGYGNGMEQWVTWQWPQSDLEMIRGTFENLYGNEASEPFNVYYMSVSGHSGYNPGENAMADLHWDKVENLGYSPAVKGYLAANIELDAALGADHFPYGLDDDGPLGSLPLLSELYGYDVNTYFARDHNRLIMWSADLEDDPIEITEPVQSIDVLPTLLNLFGCEWDSRLLPGRDIFSDKAALCFDLSYDWKSTLGTYYARTGSFEANPDVTIPEGYIEATNADVANRINFMHAVLTSDYYRHVFGDPEDVRAVHDKAKAELEKKRAEEAAKPKPLAERTYDTGKGKDRIGTGPTDSEQEEEAPADKPKPAQDTGSATSNTTKDDKVDETKQGKHVDDGVAGDTLAGLKTTIDSRSQTIARLLTPANPRTDNQPKEAHPNA